MHSLALKKQIVLCAVDGVLSTSLSSSQDMLYLLREKGPKTEGIFITSPNMTSLQILKEKLESGENVNLKNEDIHVVAALLKVGRVLASSTLRIALNLCE